MAKNEGIKEDYIVDLHRIDVSGLHVTKAFSDRQAVTHVLKRKGLQTGLVMKTLDSELGGAENFAYRIPQVHDENGNRLSREKEIEAQENYLAAEISEKTGRPEIDCLKQAIRYHEFYRNSQH